MGRRSRSRLAADWFAKLIATGDDTTGEPDETIAICNAVHTHQLLSQHIMKCLQITS